LETIRGITSNLSIRPLGLGLAPPSSRGSRDSFSGLFGPISPPSPYTQVPDIQDSEDREDSIHDPAPDNSCRSDIEQQDDLVSSSLVPEDLLGAENPAATGQPLRNLETNVSDIPNRIKVGPYSPCLIRIHVRFLSFRRNGRTLCETR
jgi:hypothetical protein